MAKYERWLTEEGLLQLEAWARDGLTDEQIAHNMDISRSTLNEWKKKYPDISDTLKRGKEVVDIQVENALLKRALGYSYDEVTRERVEDTTQKRRHEGKGDLSENEWEISKGYFNNRCAYCGCDGKLTKDHIIPFSHGGELRISNIVPACVKCNSSKKDRPVEEWYKHQSFYSERRMERITEYVKSIDDILAPIQGVKHKTVVTKVVTKEVVPDTTAQIFWLKNRKPDVWRDKKDVDVSAEDKVADSLAEFFGGLDDETE